MSEELRAAARDVVEIYSLSEGFAGRVHFHSLKVARAYLDEHPADDDEPVSNAWLWSIGFQRKEAGEIPTAWGGLARSVVIQVTDGDSYPCLWVGDEEVVMHPTRGQVRRLCAALGVELQDPGRSAG